MSECQKCLNITVEERVKARLCLALAVYQELTLHQPNDKETVFHMLSRRVSKLYP